MKDRSKNILNSVNETLGKTAQKTYKGQKRSELKDSDFLFPETRSFPIVTPQDIPDAISNFGRMKDRMTYDSFIKKLYDMAKRKGPEFVAALPKATKDKLDIDTSKAESEIEMVEKKLETQKKSAMPFNLGDKVININTSCMHYGSKGKICGFEVLPDEMGDIVVYETTNSGENWKIGDVLKKTANQLSFDYEDEENEYMLGNNEEVEEDEIEDEDMMEYKAQYYAMSVGSLKAIMHHAKDILDYLDNPMVKENLTAPHLQGIIAVAEDHMRGIHDFVMFVETDDDEYEETESEVAPENQTKKKPKKVKISDLPHYEYKYKKYPGVTTTMGQGNRPGLWENIRKKKEREGKNYKAAKPGDKDRPDPKQWKRLSK